MGQPVEQQLGQQYEVEQVSNETRSPSLQLRRAIKKTSVPTMEEIKRESAFNKEKISSANNVAEEVLNTLKESHGLAEDKGNYSFPSFFAVKAEVLNLASEAIDKFGLPSDEEAGAEISKNVLKEFLIVHEFVLEARKQVIYELQKEGTQLPRGLYDSVDFVIHKKAREAGLLNSNFEGESPKVEMAFIKEVVEMTRMMPQKSPIMPATLDRQPLRGKVAVSFEGGQEKLSKAIVLPKYLDPKVIAEAAASQTSDGDRFIRRAKKIENSTQHFKQALEYIIDGSKTIFRNLCKGSQIKFGARFLKSGFDDIGMIIAFFQEYRKTLPQEHGDILPLSKQIQFLEEFKMELNQRRSGLPESPTAQDLLGVYELVIQEEESFTNALSWIEFIEESGVAVLKVSQINTAVGELIEEMCHFYYQKNNYQWPSEHKINKWIQRLDQMVLDLGEEQIGVLQMADDESPEIMRLLKATLSERLKVERYVELAYKMLEEDFPETEQEIAIELEMRANMAVSDFEAYELALINTVTADKYQQAVSDNMASNGEVDLVKLDEAIEQFTADAINKIFKIDISQASGLLVEKTEMAIRDRVLVEIDQQRSAALEIQAIELEFSNICWLASHGIEGDHEVADALREKLTNVGEIFNEQARESFIRNARAETAVQFFDNFEPLMEATIRQSLDRMTGEQNSMIHAYEIKSELRDAALVQFQFSDQMEAPVTLVNRINQLVEVVAAEALRSGRVVNSPFNNAAWESGAITAELPAIFSRGLDESELFDGEGFQEETTLVVEDESPLSYNDIIRMVNTNELAAVAKASFERPDGITLAEAREIKEDLTEQSIRKIDQRLEFKPQDIEKSVSTFLNEFIPDVEMIEKSLKSETLTYLKRNWNLEVNEIEMNSLEELMGQATINFNKNNEVKNINLRAEEIGEYYVRKQDGRMKEIAADKFSKQIGQQLFTKGYNPLDIIDETKEVLNSEQNIDLVKMMKSRTAMKKLSQQLAEKVEKSVCTKSKAEFIRQNGLYVEAVIGDLTPAELRNVAVDVIIKKVVQRAFDPQSLMPSDRWMQIPWQRSALQEMIFQERKKALDNLVGNQIPKTDAEKAEFQNKVRDAIVELGEEGINIHQLLTEKSASMAMLEVAKKLFGEDVNLYDKNISHEMRRIIFESCKETSEITVGRIAVPSSVYGEKKGSIEEIAANEMKQPKREVSPNVEKAVANALSRFNGPTTVMGTISQKINSLFGVFAS